MLKAVLFDLDGTLLPMDQDEFVKAYFGGIAKKLAPYGYESSALIKSIWAGTEAMIKNNGEETNETRFWEVFGGIYGERVNTDKPYFDEFYENEFSKISAVCSKNPEAYETVMYLKSLGFKIALATNPIFPSIATETRISWTGLKPSDFELYTTYENINYCKPNLKYYLEIASRLGIRPEECLMVGNDVSDDMPAINAGMKVFLLTDCLINKNNIDISQFPNGSFKELRKYIESL
ncbi:MAG: HAD family hydrolase [Clostridia bacterium]|nr:HAD family hydrolase [Clostridia bacterium]